MASSKVTKRQEATWKRIQGIDPEATRKVVEGQMYVTYTPSWERGRKVSGTFRPNVNPQRLTMFVDETGKLFGFGFGNEAKPPVKLVEPITQASDMEAALKERRQSRQPVKIDGSDEHDAAVKSGQGPEVEVEVEKPKAAAKKPAAKKRATAKRSGVVVSK
jgi:hypothetical protein